ncbi:hypothetical protein AWV80_39610 [Cupriavidus sp. UYMU48A]|nr:hypothetical protein AWV80_39610 [Cupriavidus sp. UYMU48A]
MGSPDGRFISSIARQVIGQRMPRPIALEKASLAAKRVARKARPRRSERALRAWYLASSSGPSTFSAKRPRVRSITPCTRAISMMSVPTP